MTEIAPTGIPGFDELVGGLPRGELAIVAGGPGTGKTMLSASFLYWGAVKYGEKGVYASLSEDRNLFLSNMRKLGFDFEKLEKDGLFRFLDVLTLMEAGTSTLLEAMIDEVMKFGAQRFVLDPLTALAQGFKDPRELRVFLHSLLSRMMRATKCTTILIEEMPLGKEWIGYGFEEFVASTLITLERATFEEKLFRRLNIVKMRGVKIHNPKACFTLENGFKVYPPMHFRKPERPGRYQPIPDPPDGYSTGIPDLDKIVGGYPKGSVILLEVNPKLTREYYALFITPMIVDSVLKGRPTIIIPPLGVSADDLERALALYGVPKETYIPLIRVVLRNELLGKQEKPVHAILYEQGGLEEDVRKVLSTAKQLVETHRAPLIQMIAADTIGLYHGSNGVLRAVQESTVFSRRTDGFALWILESMFPEFVRKLSPIATMHFRLTRKHGCPLLYGIKPRTPLIAVEEEVSRGYPMPKLSLIT